MPYIIVDDTAECVLGTFGVQYQQMYTQNVYLICCTAITENLFKSCVMVRNSEHATDVILL